MSLLFVVVPPILGREQGWPAWTWGVAYLAISATLFTGMWDDLPKFDA